MFSFFLLACCFQVVTTFDFFKALCTSHCFNIHLLLHHSSLSRQRKEQRLCKFECTFLLFNTSEIIQSFLTAAQRKFKVSTHISLFMRFELLTSFKMLKFLCSLDQHARAKAANERLDCGNV